MTVTLRNQHADLRAIAYEALGLCCKHKVKVQLEALRLGVLDKAMEALEHDEDDTVRAKALYCLSGAPRGPVYRRGLRAAGTDTHVSCAARVPQGCCRIAQSPCVSSRSATAGAASWLPWGPSHSACVARLCFSRSRTARTRTTCWRPSWPASFLAWRDSWRTTTLTCGSTAKPRCCSWCRAPASVYRRRARKALQSQRYGGVVCHCV